MNHPQLFKGTAEYYSRYRAPYSRAIFEFLKKKIGRQKLGGRLLDIGCGTGELAIPLSGYFKEVVGVDIEREMLAEARRKAKLAGVGNIRWLRAAAEELTPALGMFDLVTLANSFHWMDQKKVLKFISGVLNENGVVAIVGGNSWWTDVEKWKRTVIGVVQKHLGEKRRAGKSQFSVPKATFEDVLSDAGFKKIKLRFFPTRIRWDIKSIIGLMYSTSFASRKLLGEKAGRFEADVEKELLAINPVGEFVEKHRFFVMTAVGPKYG